MEREREREREREYPADGRHAIGSCLDSLEGEDEKWKRWKEEGGPLAGARPLHDFSDFTVVTLIKFSSDDRTRLHAHAGELAARAGERLRAEVSRTGVFSLGRAAEIVEEFAAAEPPKAFAAALAW